LKERDEEEEKTERERRRGIKGIIGEDKDKSLKLF